MQYFLTHMWELTAGSSQDSAVPQTHLIAKNIKNVPKILFADEVSFQKILVSTKGFVSQMGFPI